MAQFYFNFEIIFCNNLYTI